MSEEPEKRSFRPLVVKITFLVLSVVFAFKCETLLIDNGNLVNLVITVYSILAGLIIGVIAILGDVGMVPEGASNVATLAKRIIERRLNYHMVLFYLYLTTIAVAFLLMLDLQSGSILGKSLRITFLTLSAYSIIESFKLPLKVKEIQLERINAVIEDRKSKERKPSPIDGD